MSWTVFLTIALLFLSPSLSLSKTSEESKPSLVIELFRHGARGPNSRKYDTPKVWNNQVNELTPAGMRMHYLLGEAIKIKYPHLLSTYNASTLAIRSTDTNASTMSVYSHLAGIFPAGPTLDPSLVDDAIPPFDKELIQKLKSEVHTNSALPQNIQAIPIHTVPKSADLVLRSYDACLYTTWGEENLADAETKTILENDLKETVAYLKEKGVEIKNITDLAYVGDLLFVNKQQKNPLLGTIELDAKQQRDLKFATEWTLAKQFEGNAKQVAAYAVPILDEVKKYVEGTVKGNSSVNFVVWGGQGNTLMTILSAFNITTPKCLLTNYRAEKQGQETPDKNCAYPQFAGNLIFELYNTSKPYVIFRYNGEAIPVCNKTRTSCSLIEFYNLIRDATNRQTLDNYRFQCKLQTRSSNRVQGLSTLETVLIPTCSILLMSLLGTCILFRKKDRKRKRSSIRSSRLESYISDL